MVKLFQLFLLDQRLGNIQVLCTSLERGQIDHTKRLEVHDSRFMHIKPILNKLISGDLSIQTGPYHNKEILGLQARIQQLEDKLLFPTPQGSSPYSDLQTQVNSLESIIQE